MSNVLESRLVELGVAYETLPDERRRRLLECAVGAAKRRDRREACRDVSNVLMIQEAVREIARDRVFGRVYLVWFSSHLVVEASFEDVVSVVDELWDPGSVDLGIIGSDDQWMVLVEHDEVVSLCRLVEA